MVQQPESALTMLLRQRGVSIPGCIFVIAAILGAGALLANDSGLRAGGSISVPGDFETIQEAIDNASDGQTIEVGPGIYDEALFIDKSLTLVSLAGSDLTLIDAGGAVNAISIGTVEGSFDPDDGIHPDFVRIEGFQVIGWTERGIAQRLGAGTVEIIGNQVTATEGDTRGGITISGGQNSRVEGNAVLGTPFSLEGISSTGIIAVGAMAAEITDNEVSGTDIGIALAAGFPATDPSWQISSNAMVTGNDVVATGFGMALFGEVLNSSLLLNTVSDVSGRAFTVGPFDDSGNFAEDLVIADNLAMNFGTSGYNSGSNPVAGIEIRDNHFQSGQEDSWGIRLGNGSSNGLITGNLVDVEFVAVGLRSVSDVAIQGNQFSGNAAVMGIFLAGHSNNLIEANELTGGIVLQDNANTDGYVLVGNQLLGGSGSLGVAVAGNADVTSGPLQATCNWWDDPGGPSGEGAGQGSIVTQNVVFEPWNTAPNGDCDGTAAIAVSLVAASSTFIAGIPDSPVPTQDLPTVQVLDQYGNPFAGVTVTFELQSGSGNITGDSPVSDGDGLAQLGSWQLGDEPVQSVTASATGLTGSPVTFVVNVDDIFHDRFEAD